MLGKDKSLEEQLKEHKEKEKKILLKIEQDKKRVRDQEELDAKIAKEKELLENAKKLKEQMEKETAIIKENERKQQEHAKKEAQKEKLKEELKDHPEGCFCPKCENLRNGTIEVEAEVEVEANTKTEDFVVEDEPKKSKFSFKKLKPKMSKEEGKELFKDYDQSKKNPNKLMSFINTQKQKIEDKNKPKPISQEGAVDTRVQPSIYTDITVLGLRLAIGFTFIAHGLAKLTEDGVGFMTMLQGWGLPPELALPIGYAELMAGLFITAGFLTRISSIIIGIIMLGAIFAIKGAATLIGQGGVELDVIILAAVALLGIFGPGRLSVANIGIKGMIFDRKLQ